MGTEELELWNSDMWKKSCAQWIKSDRGPVARGRVKSEIVDRVSS